MEQLIKLPFFVLLMGCAAVAMVFPSMIALVLDEFATARAFFYSAILLGILTSLIGIATSNYAPKYVARSQLTALLAAFVVLPVFLAIPFYEGLKTTSFLNAYFEMVSSFTTTGATLFEDPDRLNGALHFWRGFVAWLGGLLIWVTAIAILAPMNLGGFEVTASETAGQGSGSFVQISRVIAPSERLSRYALKLAPIYSGLTLVLWVSLAMVGTPPLEAVMLAMGTLSTSGISSVGGLQNNTAGFAGEALIFVFLLFALSRLTFSRGLTSEDREGVLGDPEFRIGLAFLVAAPMVLFLRHWIGAIDVAEEDNFFAAMRALWGGVFSVLSFLTTTGFEGAGWEDARNWSGFATPGLILVGLALVGGGVATTAGGVKLLRVFALYKHANRELSRLVHPSSIAGAGQAARRIRRQGAYIAWVFFMLFALSLTATMVALSLTGVQFETAVVLSAAALSTTGPLAEIAAETPILYAGIPDPAKLILAAAMVLGRLETLAIIALLNPEFWRS